MSRAVLVGTLVVGALGAGGCFLSTAGSAPIPQGRDYFFVAAGHKQKDTVQSSGSRTHYYTSGRYRYKVTHTWHYYAESNKFTGVKVPRRPPAGVPSAEANNRIRRAAPGLLQRAFRPLEVAP